MRSTSLAIAVALVLASCGLSTACLYSYGEAAHPGEAQAYNFDFWGNDWAGSESDGWVCLSGKKQSPIDFENGPSTGMKGDVAKRNTWTLMPIVANGSDVYVHNNGHTIVVNWPNSQTQGSHINVPCDAADCGVLDVVRKNGETLTGNFTAYPAQFHFHAGSEHTFAGFKGALEMHIVSFANASEVKCDTVVAGQYCVVATGIMFKVAENGHNKQFQKILDYASMTEGKMQYLPKGDSIDFLGLVPNKAKGPYMQYHGGLTTPPCMEGFLWNVFTDINHISIEQWEHYMELVSFKECTTNTTHDDSEHDDNMHNRRLMNGHSHRAHAHHAHEDDSELTRTTFVTDQGTSKRRSLLEENEWMCTVGAYGYNARQIQARNDRKIIRYN